MLEVLFCSQHLVHFTLDLLDLDFCHLSLPLDVLDASLDALELLSTLGLERLLEFLLADERLGFNLTGDEVTAELLKVINLRFDLLKLGLQVLDLVPLVTRLRQLGLPLLQDDFSLGHQSLFLSA